MSDPLSSAGTSPNPPITQLVRLVGAIELGVGISFAGWGVMYLRLSYLYPANDPHGWFAFGAGIVLWIGVGILLGGAGLLFLKKYKYWLHAPLAILLLFLADQLFRP